jgi:hypothetical protein
MTQTRPLLERIRQLEGEVQLLRRQNSGLSDQAKDLERDVAARAIWPADELLLIRLLRRTPEAVSAYAAAAELTPTTERQLILSPTTSPSHYHFCELSNGDAVVWLATDPPHWLWETTVFRQLFNCVMGTSATTNLVLQRLPSFLPIVRGHSWTLHHSGELVPRSRLADAKRERDQILSRLERLERLVQEHHAQHRVSIEELRAELRTQRELLDRLLALKNGLDG